MHFVKTESVQQCRTRTKDWLNKNGIRFHNGVYSINVDKRTCRVTFNSDRDKRSVEGILASLRKNSKSKSKVTTMRPDTKPFKRDVRKEYNEIKQLLYTYWQQFCNKTGNEGLIVSENVWSKHIFILQRVTVKEATMKKSRVSIQRALKKRSQRISVKLLYHKKKYIPKY